VIASPEQQRERRRVMRELREDIATAQGALHRLPQTWLQERGEWQFRLDEQQQRLTRFARAVIYWRRGRHCVWMRGDFARRVYKTSRGWHAEVSRVEAPSDLWPAAEATCRSRSRAVDVGRRMLSLSIARDRAVGMW
jgi:hypothetical protein